MSALWSTYKINSNNTCSIGKHKALRNTNINDEKGSVTTILDVLISTAYWKGTETEAAKNRLDDEHQDT